MNKTCCTGLSDCRIGGPPVGPSSAFSALAMAALATAYPSAYARAQGADQSAASNTPALEEVLVTATRAGNERLLDVAAAISVISPEVLAQQGAVSLEDWLTKVPSVNIVESSQGLNRIDMRGIVSTRPDFTLVQERSAVAVYLDDTPITLNNANPNLSAVQLDHIEVLRGPQGTLYGAGSMAGTIRFISKKPDSTAFSASTEVRAIDTEALDGSWRPGYSVRGSVNLPLVSDRLAVMVDAFTDRDGGYVDDVVQGNHVNSGHSTQTRAALRFTPISQLTVDASLLYLNNTTNGFNQVFPSLGNKSSSLTSQNFDDNTLISNLTIHYDFGAASLVSSTSYLRRNFGLNYSLQSLAASILPFGLRPSNSPVDNTVRNFSQEVRLLGSVGAFRWQTGAFYGHDRRTYEQNAFYQGLDGLIGAPSSDFFAPFPDDVYYGLIKTLDEQFAVFGEGTLAFASKFEFTAGIRYFNYRGPASYTQGGLFGVDANGAPLDASVTQKSTGANPRAVLKYKPADNTTLFVEAARGFRYGGVNYPVPLSFCGSELAQQGYTSAPTTFGPDSVWTYTVGEKTQIAGNRLALNTDAFFIRWNHSQTVHPLLCGFPFNENAGPITSKGLELDSQLRATDNIDLTASAAYTHATADTNLPNNGIYQGDSVPFFPRWETTVSATYHFPLGPGEFSLRSDFTYRTAESTTFDPGSSDYRTIPVYHDLGASATYKRDKWEAGVFGTNLTNSLHILLVRPDYPGGFGDRYTIGRPLTVGARFEMKF